MSHCSYLCGWQIPPCLHLRFIFTSPWFMFIYTSGQRNQSWSIIQAVQRLDVSFMLQGRVVRVMTNWPGWSKTNIFIFKRCLLIYNIINSYLCPDGTVKYRSTELLLQFWLSDKNIWNAKSSHFGVQKFYLNKLINNDRRDRSPKPYSHFFY